MDEKTDNNDLMQIITPSGSVDVSMLKVMIAIDRLFSEHDLINAKNNISPEFLVALAGEISSIGECECSPTAAWKAWMDADKVLLEEDDSLTVITVHGIKIDLIMARLEMEEIEDAHTVSSKKFQPSEEFAESLVRWIKSKGVDTCTPSEAYHIWRTAFVKLETLKKNTVSSPI